MESGVESATDSSIGVQTMPELYVDSWGFLMKVTIFPYHLLKFPYNCPNKGAYVIDEALPHVYGTSERIHIVGEVHCIGTEQELLECSHTSIGVHSCSRDAAPVPDILISCYGLKIFLFIVNSVPHAKCNKVPISYRTYIHLRCIPKFHLTCAILHYLSQCTFYYSHYQIHALRIKSLFEVRSRV